MRVVFFAIRQINFHGKRLFLKSPFPKSFFMIEENSLSSLFENIFFISIHFKLTSFAWSVNLAVVETAISVKMQLVCKIFLEQSPTLMLIEKTK